MTVYAEREFPFTDTDFDCIRTLINQHTGIVLSNAKRDLVYGRLTKRLRQLRLDSFQAYCQVLQTGDPGELEQLVNAITTNLTMFFREAHHFDALATTLPAGPHAQQDASASPTHMVSGLLDWEEPYSMAMVCKAVLPDTEEWDVKILATDIDSHVLATAQRGVYSAERVQGLSPAHLQRWFSKGQGVNTGLVRVVPALQELITFRQLNLIHSWPMRGPFDIIFCRNVVIYFDKATQRQLFERFADWLDPHGYLFVGHSESLFQITDRFELLGKTIYRRCR